MGRSMIAVTGGAGFIGSHLVDLLVSQDEQVTVIDDFSRGSMENLAGAMKTGNLKVRNTDLEHYGFPSRHDAVFHLAAKVTGIEYNRRNHYDMLATNLRINMNVVESVRRTRPRLFVYVSTACVYPHDAPVPTPESAGDIGDPEPTNHGYGVAKWAGEQLVKHLHREHGVPCLIVRFFNAFGPRDHYDEETSHVAPALIKRVVDGEDPVVVWGSGNQTRALVDARDIAKALVMLMDRMLTPETQWEGKWPSPIAVNVGHEREVTVRELAQIILNVSGSEAKLQFDASKPDGYPRRAADTELLRRMTGWVPDTPVDVTVADMVADYQSRYG